MRGERRGGDEAETGTGGGSGFDAPTAARPSTKAGERARPTGRPSSRQSSTGDRVDGGGVAGGADGRAAPAWEGSFVLRGDGASPTAEEVSVASE